MSEDIPESSTVEGSYSHKRLQLGNEEQRALLQAIEERLFPGTIAAPRVHETAVTLAGCALRQLFVRDLGHEEPTILLTNYPAVTAKRLITRYAQRMIIENSISDSVRFFHCDALSSSVGMKVDFDMALVVLASGLYRLLARRMRGYADAQARRVFRDLIDMPASITTTPTQVRVHFHCRAHLPIILASGILDTGTVVPW